MSPITFFVQGVPKGQPRVKAFSRGGHAGVYTPGTADGWKFQVDMHALRFVPKEPLQGPIRVDMVFYFPRPRAHYRTGLHAAELRDVIPQWHIGKPDFDNAAKLICDQLTTLRFWKDDSQVCDGRVLKLYAAKGTGCEITISEATTP